MEKLSLAGKWQLSQDGKPPIPGALPGSTYLDYIANGMADPFWGENETQANELARHDYRYSRVFCLSGEMLAKKHLELVADGLDTLCTIRVNGKIAGKTDNINRVWRIDVKDLCAAGNNSIDIDFANPYAEIEKRQNADPLPGGTPIPGVGHLRKPPCHFGWDWGPKLPPAGVARSIGLEAYDLRAEDLLIRQQHKDGGVTLTVTARLSDTAGEIAGSLKLTGPDGTKSVYAAVSEGGVLRWEILINNPRLWWCNGLGGQPLYQIDIDVTQNGGKVESLHRQIGLRTIALDTSPDRYGNQFRFIVNGVPIFVKGANWIPPDSFITRADRATMFFYAEAAKRANMNMLRVWGGGMFENEDFYDACDANGILVWQDFIFACNAYPLYDESYLENVHAEVTDNVRRLRHRASLALWCGNNENEVYKIFWKKGSPVRESNPAFYHITLRRWVAELDDATPYWPGSPSSGSSDRRLGDMKPGQTCGDTHLWHIWHGMRKIEDFRKFPTRFCSEYGMESMPSMHTIRSFTNEKSPGLFDPVMVLHQKCASGNEKMLYYLLAKYRNPEKFEDFVYLSQIVQANTVRFATDCWRRNIGRQNGAIFWQLNDCWPVASWAGIDYRKQLKAVVYQSRHFNKPLCLSNDYFGDRAEIYVTNEYPKDFSGKIEWVLRDFDGNGISGGDQALTVSSVSSKRAVILRFSDILKGRKKNEAVLEVRLMENGGTKDRKFWLLVPDKNAALPKANVTFECSAENGAATVKLSSKTFARYVCVEAEGVTKPWSDNYFDIPAGESVVLTAELPEGMTAEQLQSLIKIKTLTDVEPKNGPLKDKWLRVSMMFRKKNYVNWILYKTLFQ